MIESDSMQCDRQSNTCEALGHVVVMKGNFNLKSHKLITKIRKNKLGKQEIWEVEATGDVKFKGSAGETASAPYALYNVDENKLILTVFDHTKENNELFPTLQKEQHLVCAKEIIIYFKKSSDNKTELQYVEAKGDVLLSTPIDLAHGDFATYDPTLKLAKLTGNVVIDRDNGQISGTYAEVNLDTGTSKMLSVAPGIKECKKRVQVLLKPKHTQQTVSTTQSAK
jgi:lipopolysaccharide export system protein LptA